MSRELLVGAYVRGDISRRTFVRRSVALGVSLAAALSYADLLGRTSTARAQDFGGFYYDCEPFYEGAEGDPPTAETLGVEDVTDTSATLLGHVDLSGSVGGAPSGSASARRRLRPHDAAPRGCRP